jgi:hypothetical protein
MLAHRPSAVGLLVSSRGGARLSAARAGGRSPIGGGWRRCRASVPRWRHSRAGRSAGPVAALPDPLPSAVRAIPSARRAARRSITGPAGRRRRIRLHPAGAHARAGLAGNRRPSAAPALRRGPADRDRRRPRRGRCRGGSRAGLSGGLDLSADPGMLPAASAATASPTACRATPGRRRRRRPATPTVTDAEPTARPRRRRRRSPPAPTPTPPPPPVQTYAVQAGDTLAELAVRFGTTVEALQALNGIDDPDEIVIGQVLVLP